VKINLRASSLHAAIVGLANAVVQLASSFGVHLTGDQDVAITSCMNAALVVASILFINGTSSAKAS
jgi:hypothetical protein